MKKRLSVLIIFMMAKVAYSQPNLNSGLIACYPFSGNANDMSGFGHNGVLLGPVLTADRFGNANSAYLYDGINDYINIGSLSTFTASNEFSISVWIQPNQVKLQTILMAMPDNFYDRLNAMAYYSHNGVSSTIWDFGNCTSGGRLMQLGTVFSNAWQHWVYTVSQLSGMKVYKNGVLDISQASSSMVNNRQRNLWIGGGFDAAGAPFYFDGVIDDMRIYERELSATEVQMLYGIEMMCTPTGIANNDLTPTNFNVSVTGDHILVKVKSDMPSSTFSLMNSEGKKVFEKENVKGGDQFEASIEEIAKGLLIYSFQTIEGRLAGKLFH